MHSTIVPVARASARLRTKNQLTLPEPIATAIAAGPGAKLLFTVDETGLVTLRKARESLAGAFAGVWGDTPAEVEENLRELRDSWDRHEP